VEGVVGTSEQRLILALMAHQHPKRVSYHDGNRPLQPTQSR